MYCSFYFGNSESRISELYLRHLLGMYGTVTYVFSYVYLKRYFLQVLKNYNILRTLEILTILGDLGFYSITIHQVGMVYEI